MIFHNKVFEYMCKTYLNMTPRTYYLSDIANNYFKNDITINISI